MATVKMMQGDSYPVMVNLTYSEGVLTPDMVAEVEICIGDSIRKTSSADEVLFSQEEQQWYFTPTQKETLAMEPGTYEAIARVKFADTSDANVKGISIGRVVIIDSLSEEVI